MKFFFFCDLNQKTKMKLVPYRISPVNKNYYDWQYGIKWEMVMMGKKEVRTLKSNIFK